MANQSDKPPYKGRCLCGAINYEVDKIEPKIGHCHCTMCRKFHGAAFATYAGAKQVHFRWLSGEHLLKTYLASNNTKRQFCEHCGSSMTFSPANDLGEVIEFALGTLESDIPHRPDAHIYRDNAANWLELNDNLPQHTQRRDSKLLTK